MADEWQDAQDFVDEHSGGSFFKLEDGQKEVVAFLGAPYPHEVAFVNNERVPVTDELRRKGAKIQTKVAINVYLFGERETKIWDMSAKTFRELQRLRAKYGLDKRPFEVSRQGTGMKTVYPIMPEDTFTPEQQAQLKAADVHNLREFFSAAEV